MNGPAGWPVLPGNTRVWCEACDWWAEAPTLGIEGLLARRRDHWDTEHHRPQRVRSSA